MAQTYQPMRTLFAIQHFECGDWVTKQLFIVRDFAEAKVLRLGDGWRLQNVQREIYD